jgi:putative addiction module killer protein
MNQVRELLLEDGSSPFADWFNGLSSDVAAKVATAQLRMQQSNLSNVEWFRGIGEYKIDFGPGWRIYLARDGIQIIVLLGGGSKKGQQKDIERAIMLWEDYKHRKSQMLKEASKRRKE